MVETSSQNQDQQLLDEIKKLEDNARLYQQEVSKIYHVNVKSRLGSLLLQKIISNENLIWVNM